MGALLEFELIFFNITLATSYQGEVDNLLPIRLHSFQQYHHNQFFKRQKAIIMRPVYIALTLGFHALFMTGGSGANAQMVYALEINGKDVLAGIFVQVQNPDRTAETMAMVSGQSDFNIGDSTYTATAGELMTASEGEIHFLPSERTDIGEVGIALGPETVFCLADGTISNDWLAVGENAVAIVPQDGGPAISVRNSLWMVNIVDGFSSLQDPSCSNTDYPVLIVK